MDTVCAFGRWPSPLGAGQAAAGKASRSEITSDAVAVYWLESRPRDGGRVVFVRSDGATVEDLSPPGVSIRSRVHEYGGGACCLVPHHGLGAFAYVDADDQRVWLQGGASDVPVALTEEPPGGERWAHGGLGSSTDGDWVVAVREVLRGARRPWRGVVALGTRPHNAGATIVAQGHDFYGAPRLRDDVRQLATVVWDHPDMPWDRSAVMVTPLERARDATTGAPRLVAAGPPWPVRMEGDSVADVSVGQPAWRGDGSLHFVADRHGWWQPFVHGGTPDGGPARALTALAAEFHGPDWALGQSTMAQLPDGTVVARVTSEGRDALVRVSDGDLSPHFLAQPCVAISGLCAHGDGIAYLGAPSDEPASVWILADPRAPTPRATPLPSVWRAQPAPALARRDVSVGQPFTCAGRSGRPVHGLVYRPRRDGLAGPPGARPPLVAMCHGGPTGAVGAGYDVVVQYFTSRGFAVAAVDYCGSTGYGRTYRCSLWGQWGVADAEDCVDAARYLARRGDVDATRMGVRGASAGGLTALNALADGHGDEHGFAAAVSWYGVTDLLALAASTHDFEAHYSDRLVGLLPESRPIYEARSPTNRAKEISGAVLLFQGLADPVVPPAQAEQLRDALVAEGRRCEVRFFEGEGHGFRRASTLEVALEEELAFYQRELCL